MCARIHARLSVSYPSIRWPSFRPTRRTSSRKSEGTGLTPEAVKELRRATDLALKATKHTARAVGRPMSGSVAAECHLWLNLTEISEKEEVFLLDAPISQSGLFGEAVSSVVEKFRSAKMQSTALKQFAIKTERCCSMQCTERTRAMHHSIDFYLYFKSNIVFGVIIDNQINFLHITW